MVTFKIEPDSIGFHAWSPELPGCHTYCANRTEALVNLKDAVRLYLEDVAADC
jgi:predicted RNase H-like HicB family nuclease